MRRHIMKHNLLILLVIGVLASSVFGAPVDPKKKDEEKNDENKVDNADESLDEFGLEYGRYLQQVVQALEEDKEFAKKLENVTADQIRSGQIAKELEFVNHKVRNKLDELKRMELERLRKLARQEMERNDLGLYRDQNGHLAPIPPDGRRWRTIPRNRWGSDSDDDDEDDDGFGDPWLGLDRKNIKMPQHLNIRNPSTFEVEDLMHLIKTATRDLEKLDQKRREEFKKYEMEKEHKYRESLKNMNEEERKAAIAKHEEMMKKHKEHPKVHHPGSKPQLEEVWEEQDHLPKEEFDPKTFFALHDVNGDGYLDEQEVEAILSLEIKKMYDPNNAEDDPVEMMEEYNRMREHIYKEADTNKDGLISRKEFDDMVKRADFEQDEGWKGLDEQTVYTDEEFREYERQLQMQQYGYPQPPTHPYGGGGYPPQQQPYHGQEMPHQAGVPMNQQGVPHHQQGVPYGMPQQGIQQGVHPNQYQQQGVPIQQYQAVPQGQQYQAVPMQHHQQQQQQQHPQAIPQQQQQQQHYGVGMQHQPHPNQIGAGSLPQQAHPPVPQAGASQQAPPNFQGQQGGNAQHPIHQQQQQQQQPQVQSQQIPQQQQQQQQQQQPQKHS